jgi:hypothetical protein
LTSGIFFDMACIGVHEMDLAKPENWWGKEAAMKKAL